MKTKPMIFNAEMVQALVSGKKTVTRRQVKPEPEPSGLGYDWWPSNKFGSMIRVSDFESIKFDYARDGTIDIASDACPIANIGDLIWVRETFCHGPCGNASELILYRSGYPQPELKRKYESVMSGEEIKWTPSIHMPRWASRLTLKVTDVRIERVQKITEEQAVMEGMPTDEECQRMAVDSGLGWHKKPTVWFKELWNRIYSNWSDNPYVWVIEFEVIHQNIDKYLELMEAV